MSRHQYPFRVLAPDYFRAGAGACVSLLPLALVDVAPAMGWALAVVAGLFVGFGGRTLLRQMSSIEMDEQALTVTGPLPPMSATLPWEKLNMVDLRYFSTRRDRSGGWMQLKLRGGGRTIRIDSTLDGFADVARRAGAAANHGNVSVSRVSRANFAALDVALKDPGEETAGHAFGQGAGAE
jgi:hypothetical protein